MAKALLAAIGATPPPETPLDPVVRKRAYEANFAEARRLLTEDDLSGALEAAKRAQSLDNTRTGIVSLIKVIAERLRSAETVERPPAGAPGTHAGSAATRAVISGPLRTPAGSATMPALPAPRGRSTPRRSALAGRAPSARSAPSGSRPPPRRRCSPRWPTSWRWPARTAPSGCGTCARATAPTCCAPTCTGAPATTRRPSASASRPTARFWPPPTWTGSCTCGTWRRPKKCRSTCATTSPWGRSRSHRRRDARHGLARREPAPVGRGGGALPARRAASWCGSRPG